MRVDSTTEQLVSSDAASAKPQFCQDAMGIQLSFGWAGAAPVVALPVASAFSFGGEHATCDNCPLRTMAQRVGSTPSPCLAASSAFCALVTALCAVSRSLSGVFSRSFSLSLARFTAAL